jgi:hypothetical protein
MVGLSRDATRPRGEILDVAFGRTPPEYAKPLGLRAGALLAL